MAGHWHPKHFKQTTSGETTIYHHWHAKHWLRVAAEIPPTDWWIVDVEVRPRLDCRIEVGPRLSASVEVRPRLDFDVEM